MLERNRYYVHITGQLFFTEQIFLLFHENVGGRFVEYANSSMFVNWTPRKFGNYKIIASSTLTRLATKKEIDKGFIILNEFD